MSTIVDVVLHLFLSFVWLRVISSKRYHGSSRIIFHELVRDSHAPSQSRCYTDGDPYSLHARSKGPRGVLGTEVRSLHISRSRYSRVCRVCPRPVFQGLPIAMASEWINAISLRPGFDGGGSCRRGKLGRFRISHNASPLEPHRYPPRFWKCTSL